MEEQSYCGVAFVATAVVPVATCYEDLRSTWEQYVQESAAHTSTAAVEEYNEDRAMRLAEHVCR